MGWRNMKRRTPILVAAALIVSLAAAPAFAGGTAGPNPSCFGAARAAYATSQAPGSVGDAASARAGDNSTINHAYMADPCGGPLQPPG
jgi:hypothetical protein